MQLTGGGNHVHHHGLLAGVSAGAAAVVAGLALVLIAWHEVGRSVGEAVTVLVWAAVAAVLAAVAYAVAFLFPRLRHHVRYPETLTRQAVRAGVIPGQVVAADAPAVPAVKPAAALPPGVHHTWRLPQDPDAAIAIIRAVSGGRDQQ